MEINLTRDDYIGWQSQIAMNVKVAMMKVKEGEQALDWIKKVIKKMPKPKNAKTKV